MAGDHQPPPAGRPRGEPTPLWPRFVTWPVAVRVVLWVVGWPFVLASRARHEPGTSPTTRAAATALAVVVGVPWLLALAALLVLAVPVDLDEDVFGDGDVLFAPLDPVTTPPPPVTADPTEADGPGATTVERIVDGDTLVLAAWDERVRLVGIDAPERDTSAGPECLAEEAADRLADLVPPGTAVRVTTDVDQVDGFGRPLVYLHRVDDDLFVNEELVAGGFATVLTVPPNVTHAEAFTAAEESAREAGLGLWSGRCGDDATG